MAKKFDDKFSALALGMGRRPSLSDDSPRQPAQMHGRRPSLTLPFPGAAAASPRATTAAPPRATAAVFPRATEAASPKPAASAASLKPAATSSDALASASTKRRGHESTCVQHHTTPSPLLSGVPHHNLWMPTHENQKALCICVTPPVVGGMSEYKNAPFVFLCPIAALYDAAFRKHFPIETDVPETAHIGEEWLFAEHVVRFLLYFVKDLDSITDEDVKKDVIPALTLHDGTSTLFDDCLAIRENPRLGDGVNWNDEESEQSEATSSWLNHNLKVQSEGLMNLAWTGSYYAKTSAVPENQVTKVQTTHVMFALHQPLVRNHVYLVPLRHLAAIMRAFAKTPIGQSALSRSDKAVQFAGVLDHLETSRRGDEHHRKQAWPSDYVTRTLRLLNESGAAKLATEPHRRYLHVKSHHVFVATHAMSVRKLDSFQEEFKGSKRRKTEDKDVEMSFAESALQAAVNPSSQSESPLLEPWLSMPSSDRDKDKDKGRRSHGSGSRDSGQGSGQDSGSVADQIRSQYEFTLAALEDWVKNRNWDKIENKHSFIQILFALRSPGTANQHLVLQSSDVQKLKEDGAYLGMVKRAFAAMMTFFGMELRGETLDVIDKTRYTRYFVYGGRGEHNYLRITRIMKHLRYMDRGVVSLAHENAALRQRVRNRLDNESSSLPEETRKEWTQELEKQSAEQARGAEPFRSGMGLPPPPPLESSASMSSLGLFSSSSLGTPLPPSFGMPHPPSLGMPLPPSLGMPPPPSRAPRQSASQPPSDAVVAQEDILPMFQRLVGLYEQSLANARRQPDADDNIVDWLDGICDLCKYADVYISGVPRHGDGVRTLKSLFQESLPYEHKLLGHTEKRKGQPESSEETAWRSSMLSNIFYLHATGKITSEKPITLVIISVGTSVSRSETKEREVKSKHPVASGKGALTDLGAEMMSLQQMEHAAHWQFLLLDGREKKRVAYAWDPAEHPQYEAKDRAKTAGVYDYQEWWDRYMRKASRGDVPASLKDYDLVVVPWQLQKGDHVNCSVYGVFFLGHYIETQTNANLAKLYQMPEFKNGATAEQIEQNKISVLFPFLTSLDDTSGFFPWNKQVRRLSATSDLTWDRANATAEQVLNNQKLIVEMRRRLFS